MVDRLIHWLVFALLASLVPIAADAIIRAGDDKKPLSWAALLGHGQLLLVAVAIVFPAVGAILMSDAGVRMRGIFGGFAMVGLVLIAILYARYASASPYNAHF